MIHSSPIIASEARIKQSQAYNQEYLALLQMGEQGHRKLSELHRSQLAHYLRETCVFDKILTPEDITAADCEVGIDNDTLFKRIYFTPEIRMFLSSFESLPREVQEIFIPRIFLGFYLLTSPKIVLNDYNLMAYPFPVSKQVEDIIGPAMHEAVDWIMMDRLEEAIQNARGTYNNVLRGVQAEADISTSGLNSGFRGLVERDDFLRLKKYYSNTRARIARVLMTDSDYIDYERLKLSDFGDELVADVQENGLSQERIHGMTIIRTIKSDFDRGDLLRPGNIYAFADEDMVGKSYVLQGIKFYIERDHQFLFFDAHQARGFIWAVASRVSKLELYNGGLDITGAPVVAATPAPPAGQPFSDQLWGDPSDVTFKDYFNVQQANHRPNIFFS